MSKQVLNRKQMHHLKEMGVDTSKASMALIYENKHGDVVDWEIVDDDIHEFHIGEYNPYLRSKYGTFTLQDILDLLPKVISYTKYEGKLCIEYNKVNNRWVMLYKKLHIVIHVTYDDDLIDAAYKMLCWCIEKNLVKKLS